MPASVHADLLWCWFSPYTYPCVLSSEREAEARKGNYKIKAPTWMDVACIWAVMHPKPDVVNVLWLKLTWSCLLHKKTSPRHRILAQKEESQCEKGCERLITYSTWRAMLLAAASSALNFGSPSKTRWWLTPCVLLGAS